jgi:hypothetical protein
MCAEITVITRLPRVDRQYSGSWVKCCRNNRQMILAETEYLSCDNNRIILSGRVKEQESVWVSLEPHSTRSR